MVDAESQAKIYVCAMMLFLSVGTAGFKLAVRIKEIKINLSVKMNSRPVMAGL
jgi:hypothetical protein